MNKPAVRRLKWSVSAKENGLKLITFLQIKLGDKISNKQLKKRVESNTCEVNGRPERFASRSLKSGDQVVFFDAPLVETAKSLFAKERVLFEDASFLVYNKPPGFTCDSKGLKSLGRPELILTHRLDKETSGILIFAKTKEAADAMEELFRKRAVHKRYLAFVDGVLTEKSGLLENFIGVIKKYEGNAIYGVVKQGQMAITNWQLEKRGKAASLVSCYPITGRTHQIRVHLSHIGHPILGDPVYGKRFLNSYRPGRILLHAFEIRFKHPSTASLIELKAPIPDDFKEARNALL